MALDLEKWALEAEEILFPDNSVMNRSTNDSDYITSLFGTPKTVHIPQSGANPGIAVNRSSLPATITQRTDDDYTYDMNQFTSNPVLLTALEQQTISYDKRKSFLYQHMGALNTVICNNTIYSWAPTASTNVVYTTGATSSGALAPSATGLRNQLTLADITRAKSVLDLQNVPDEGRILLVPSQMYNNDILNINNVQSFYAYGTAILPNGKAKDIMNFEIITRPKVLVYDNAGAPKAITQATGEPTSPASTDNLACLAYHPNFVSCAKNGIKFRVREDAENPEYYGTIISAEIWLGSGRRRKNQDGICAIVQA